MKIKIAMLKQADINNVKKLPVGPSLSECSLLCCQVMEARRAMRKRGHRKISLMINDLITIKYCNAKNRLTQPYCQMSFFLGATLVG